MTLWFQALIIKILLFHKYVLPLNILALKVILLLEYDDLQGHHVVLQMLFKYTATIFLYSIVNNCISSLTVFKIAFFNKTTMII